EDYEKAGFQMISSGKNGATYTGRSALFYSLALIPAAISPCLMEISGGIYCTGAVFLSIGFVSLSWKFSQEMTLESARRLFYYSLLYLPLLLGLMAWDRIA
ncbi:uncharacterized protein METZ01_LOCUS332735, partial [marine metagenome]